MEELNLLADFPREIIVIICSFTESGSLITLSIACKYLQELIHDNMDYIVYHATNFRCFANTEMLKAYGVDSKEKLWNTRNWHEHGIGQEECFTTATICETAELPKLAAIYDDAGEILSLGSTLRKYAENRGIEITKELINQRFTYTGSDIYDRVCGLFISNGAIRLSINRYQNVMSVVNCEKMRVYLLNSRVPNIRILCNAKEVVLPKIFRTNKIYDFAVKKTATGFDVSVNILATEYLANYNAKGVLTNLSLVNKSA